MAPPRLTPTHSGSLGMAGGWGFGLVSPRSGCWERSHSRQDTALVCRRYQIRNGHVFPQNLPEDPSTIIRHNYDVNWFFLGALSIFIIFIFTGDIARIPSIALVNLAKSIYRFRALELGRGMRGSASITQAAHLKFSLANCSWLKFIDSGFRT